MRRLNWLMPPPCVLGLALGRGMGAPWMPVTRVPPVVEAISSSKGAFFEVPSSSHKEVVYCS